MLRCLCLRRLCLLLRGASPSTHENLPLPAPHLLKCSDRRRLLHLLPWPGHALPGQGQLPAPVNHPDSLSISAPRVPTPEFSSMLHSIVCRLSVASACCYCIALLLQLYWLSLKRRVTGGRRVPVGLPAVELAEAAATHCCSSALMVALYYNITSAQLAPELACPARELLLAACRLGSSSPLTDDAGASHTCDQRDQRALLRPLALCNPGGSASSRLLAPRNKASP